MSTHFPVDPATRLRRHPERASYDRAAVHALLDAHWVCQIAFVHEGQPHVLPTAYWREGEHLYIHGSNGSRLLRQLLQGASCTNVCHVDGLVLARSAFSHSANYRSVNLYGRYQALEDPADKQRAFEAFFDAVLPGRWSQVRAPNRKEIAATTVLRLPIERAVLKARSGGPIDDPEDADWPCWAGVLPFAWLRQAPAPEPGHGTDPGAAVLARWPG
ncbi:MAG TPA: pyridoxamine 5'-phosphate oxidase family protein [Arenimonas sp.]|nr:pyridoxamine 5'-phosphate oxidase family protein [Arenimonas sp.]